MVISWRVLYDCDVPVLVFVGNSYKIKKVKQREKKAGDVKVRPDMKG